MNKKIFAIFLFITTIISTNSYSQWFWVNPYPQGNFLYDIYMKDANTGWISGDAGTILRTTNGGINWIYQPVNFSDVISSIQFLTPDYALAAASDWNGNGVIYKSTNFGLNFIRDTIFSGIPLIKIFFINENTGWLGGSHGMVLFTSNNGLTWLQRNTPSNSDINGIHFFNLNSGIAASFDGYILKTSNGGVNWSIVSYSNNKHYFGLYFFNSLLGFVFGGYNGDLMRTTDGGNTFQDLSNGQFFGEYIFDIKFVNEQTGWMALGDGYYPKGIFKSSNGGLNWFSQNFYNKGLESLTKLHICNIDTLFCVGDYGTILKTINSGINWNYQTKGVLKWLNCIDFVDENTGWMNAIFDGNNSIYKSTDGGDNWDSIATFSNQYRKVYFLNNLTGFTIGQYGKIVRTSDGGNVWDYIESGTNQNNLGICFLNEMTGWITGVDGVILKSTNSGLNWNKISDLNDELPEIFATNEYEVWVCGYDSIYKSTNGGEIWRGFKVLSNNQIEDLNFLSSNTGWGCGTGGAIIKTTNGGDNWEIQNSGTINNLHEIVFLNKDTGYVCGDNSLILKTTDSGINWIRCFMPNVANFYIFFSMDFVNKNTGWIAGVWGVVLKTTNGGSTFITKENYIVPENFILHQNYPNPFNSSTQIIFELPKNGVKRTMYVKLTVYDITGREIKILVNNHLSEGVYKVFFDGGGLSSGIFFYSLNVDGNIYSKKMFLTK